jgi:uncharacterized protein YfaS (alpha-2-macroglobulin family)
MEQLQALSGKLAEEQTTLKLPLDMPLAREADLVAEVVLSPSLALSLVDALPYLAQYPYGCTEQTLSRFVPSVVVRQTLVNLGLDKDQVQAMLDQSLAAADPPQAQQTLGELDAMVADGLHRLAALQRADGSWGWWDGGRADPFMSAYALWSLVQAQRAGAQVNHSMLERAEAALQGMLSTQSEDYATQAWLLYALSERSHMDPEAKPSREEAQVSAWLWKNREFLSDTTRALLALSMHQVGFQDEAEQLARLLIATAQPVGSQTASTLLEGSAEAAAGAPAGVHWGQPSRWHWQHRPVEATAFSLMALAAILPEAPEVEQAVHWLVHSRKAGRWEHTLDTALAVLALSRYASQVEVQGADWVAAVSVDGQRIGEVSAADYLSGKRGRLQLPAAELGEGKRLITVERLRGQGPVYASAHARYWTLEQPIRPAGNGLFAKRTYQRLRPVSTLLAGTQLIREPLDEAGGVVSGERIEVTLTLEVRHATDYVMVEDAKPAGLEALTQLSGARIQLQRIGADGHGAGPSPVAHQVVGNRHVTHFIEHLPAGTWQLTYQLRAEVPGTFSALPTLVQAMYVPQLQGNSAEAHLKVLAEAAAAMP